MIKTTYCSYRVLFPALRSVGLLPLILAPGILHPLLSFPHLHTPRQSRTHIYTKTTQMNNGVTDTMFTSGKELSSHLAQRSFVAHGLLCT